MVASEVESHARRDGFTTREALLLYVGFAALVTWVYRAALQGPFVADDDIFYVSNPFTTIPTLENLGEIVDPRGLAKHYTLNYAPVHLLLCAAELRIFGGEVLGYHLVNLALHALNGVLLVALLSSSQLPRGAALLGGLLFALHPANVEAVAWASQLKSIAPLSLGLGALLTLWRHPGFATALFALALLTKFTAAALLPMAVALAWTRRVPVERAGPWLWLAAWAAAVGLIALPQLGAFASGGGLQEEAFADRGIWLRSIVAYGAQYLGMAATGLGVSAYHEPAPASSWLDPRWLAGLALGALLAWRLLLTLRQRQEEAAWWVGAAAGFLPVSQLVPFRYPVADRYLYFMLPGLIGGVLLFLHTTGRVWLRRSSERMADAAGRAALAGGAALALLLALHSAQRAALWVEPFRLFVDAAAHYPEGSQAHYVRAVQAAHAGDVERAVAELRAGEEKKRMSLVTSFAVDPYLAPIHHEPAFRDFVLDTARYRLELARRRGVLRGEQLTLAAAHEALGEYDEAIALLEEALRQGDPRRELLLAALERVRALRAEQRGRP